MAKIKDIINALETAAPLETQEEWDNSGWQINSGKENAEKILISLNVTDDVVKQAAANNCGLIISHHPLIFSPLKSIKNGSIMQAIKNNIDVYSIHTNFDRAEIGTTSVLAEKLGFKETHDINDFVKLVSLENPLIAKDLSMIIKEKLNLPSLKCANFEPLLKITKIALCAGSGSGFIKDAKSLGADCFITGDVKFHEALDSGIVIFDIGHFESEVIALESIKNLLKNFDAEVIIAKEEPVFEIL